MTDAWLPQEAERYLMDVVGIVRQTLGAYLVGIYVSGSAGQGDYQQGRSDLDLLAVTSEVPESPTVARLIAQLGHDRLPCPAEGMELYVVTADVAAVPGESPRFVLELSTGRDWEFEAETNGEDDELLLAFALCRRFGQTLFGPAPTEVFSPIPDDALRTVVRGIVEWHRPHLFDAHHDPGGINSTLNACRAWRFAVTGELGSKTEGGLWARSHYDDPALIEAALLRRQGAASASLEPGRIERLLDWVLKTL